MGYVCLPMIARIIASGAGDFQRCKRFCKDGLREETQRTISSKTRFDEIVV
jgi:hypothetical protein